MRRPEILAPAGGRSQLEAAVRCGANGVYLGSKGFNARRSAENFDRDGLAEAVRYCHGRDVAVHVTLNTLVTDSEIERLTEEIRLIADSGADAIIVQDLGVAALVRECCPTLAVHASTQLSVHNAAGALFMKSLGFKRLVLARELTAGEIAEIKAKSGLEIEVFVHGALCTSMSGSCYLSALVGERSGNRGMCAQPCRLNFNGNGREYALSLKDLTLIPHMAELVEAGVDSLKIEGRMKRPEYVAAAVTACKQALEGQQPDMDRLQAVFSRSGFTDGYFTGKRDIGMFGHRTREDVAAASGVLGELAGCYRDEKPLIPIDMEFKALSGENISLTVTDGIHSVKTRGTIPQRAINRPTDEELVRRGLEKLGGTPFFLDKLTVMLEEGLMVPVSAINALRKEAAEKLLALREYTEPHRYTPPKALPSPVAAGSTPPKLYLRLENVGQLTAAVKNAASVITLPLEELYSHRELLTLLGDRLAAELPMFIFGGNVEKTVKHLEELHKAGLHRVTAGSQGTLELAKASGMEIIGDYSLNILNSVALGEYERMGLSEATISFESAMKAARQMDSRIPTGVLGYGYLPVMSFRSCPAHTANGCGGCNGATHITDRLGNKNPLLCRGREYSQLLNCLPLYLGDRQEVLGGLDFVTLYMTIENPAKVDEVLALWQYGEAYTGKRTGGLYFRDLQ